MEFLPGDHPRVLATIDRLTESLTLDGYLYRFDPLKSGAGALPLGEFEGAFLPCNFWLATAYAKAGRCAKAESILRRAEELVGKPALFAEAVDPRTRGFLGNMPLLFSHAEYVRAKLELAAAQRRKQREDIPMGDKRLTGGRTAGEVTNRRNPFRSTPAWRKGLRI